MDNQDNTNTEKWNTAKTYSALMIMKNLFSCDVYIMISKYGSEEINDSLMMMNQQKIYSRLEAIERYRDTLKLIFKNTVKFIKKKDKNQFDKLRELLISVEEVLYAVKEIKINMGTNESITTINEEHFYLCLETLMKINEDLIEPLNNAGLIFKETEELDLDEIKKRIIEGG